MKVKNSVFWFSSLLEKYFQAEKLLIFFTLLLNWIVLQQNLWPVLLLSLPIHALAAHKNRNSSGKKFTSASVSY